METNKVIKKVGPYLLEKKIGQGSFAVVYTAINENNPNEKVAIKCILKDLVSKLKLAKQVKQEISIMKSIQHKHIIDLREVLMSDKYLYLVMEWAPNGELFDLIASKGRLSEKEAIYYFKQLLSALDYCHQLGICHRDLKPENLLLDINNDLKVADFGFAKTIEFEEIKSNNVVIKRMKKFGSTCGTINYIPPEIINNIKYNGIMSDIWSCGVILYVLLAGQLPFDDEDNYTLLSKIKRLDFKYPHWFSEQAVDLLQHILVRKPDDRYTIAQINGHPFMQEDYRLWKKFWVKNKSRFTSIYVKKSSNSDNDTEQFFKNQFTYIDDSDIILDNENNIELNK